MKKVIRLTESDLIRLVKKVIKENDLGLPRPGGNAYKELFHQKLSEAISEAGDDSEGIYESLCLKLDDIMETWRAETGEGGRWAYPEE